MQITMRTSAPPPKVQGGARHAEVDAALRSLTVGEWYDIDERPTHTSRATSLAFHHRAKALGMHLDTVVEAGHCSLVVRSKSESATASATLTASATASEAPTASAKGKVDRAA